MPNEPKPVYVVVDDAEGIRIGRCDVIKETEHTLLIDRYASTAFKDKTRLTKGKHDFHRSAEEAWTAEADRRLSAVESIRGQLQKAEEQLRRFEEARKTYDLAQGATVGS